LSMGHYDAQIRKMSAALQARREAMQQAIDAAGLHVAGMGAFGGSSFWMQAPRDVDTDDRAKALEARSVLIEPGHAFFAGDAPPRNYYRLGYSSIPLGRIAEGLGLVRDTLHS
ncbi:MAG: GntR family transcriptional regulator, partial [Planctomycetota bacterium]